MYLVILGEFDHLPKLISGSYDKIKCACPCSNAHWFVSSQNNMAGFPTLLKVILPFCEFMDDDDSYFYQHHTEETCALVLSQKREWTPKVSNYMETVFHEFSIPENIDDFRVHYRVSRHLFEILLQEIYESILLRGTGPQETTQPHKQLLVTLWYLSNMASMREVGHIFDMSKSTVHAVVFRVFDAILGLQPRVRECISIENIYLSIKDHLDMLFILFIFKVNIAVCFFLYYLFYF